MKRAIKEVFRTYGGFFGVVALMLVCTAVFGIVGCNYGKTLEEKIAKMEEDSNKLIEELEQLKKDALEAIEDGYAIYCNGIKVDRDDVIIDSLLKYNTVVLINHEERYVELKN